MSARPVGGGEPDAVPPALGPRSDPGQPADPARTSEPARDRIHALELENARLKRVVASQALTIEALREISRGTY